MAKKNTPIITHTEILCLAIESLKASIREWDENVEKAAGKDVAVQQIVTELRDQNVARLAPKLAAPKQLYKIETGTDYN